MLTSLPSTIDTGFASSSPKLTAEGTPFAKLHDVIEAVLYPSAVEYDLPISVLLKGSRGIGKQTVVRWVARKLGVHVYEVRDNTLRNRLDSHNME